MLPHDFAPLKEEVSVFVLYLYKDQAKIDLDNMLKPILDALKGVIITDDSLISQITARKSHLTSDRNFENATPFLSRLMDRLDEFIYIRIGPAPNHKAFPI